MKILIPVEDEDFAALQTEFVLSRKWDDLVSFYILHVIHEGYGVSDEPLRMSRHYGEQLVKKIIHKLEKDIPEAGLMMSIEEGTAAAVILRTAQEWKADLIVLGSHGRTGIGNAVLGSVAHDVLAGSPCRTIILGMPHAQKVKVDLHEPSLSKIRFSQ